MRKLMVLPLWIVATGLVVYAANAAVRAVDRQVFPDGASIQVLSTTTTTTTTTTTLPPSTTTLASDVTTTTLPPPTTTLAPLVISTEEIPGGTTGGTYLVWLRITGGRAPFTWSVTSGGLPAGLEITPSGLIRGIPVKPGEYSFGLRVDDAQGNAAGSLFTTSFVDPLKIETSFIADVLVGAKLEENLVASGGEQPHIWDITQGSLPDGFSFTEDGFLSGVSESPTSSEFVVRLTDSTGNSVDRQISLKILDPVRIQTPSLLSGVSGSEYSLQMSVMGGSAPYEWILSDGLFPDGVTLSSDGLITGIPQVVSKTFPTIRVTDSAGRSAALTYEFETLVGEERQAVAARGGTVNIEIIDNTLKLLEIVPNDGFAEYLVISNSEKIQVHFIGEGNQIPSWVLCEAYSIGICSFD